MTLDELDALLDSLPAAEREELLAMADADLAAAAWRPLPGPQQMAYESEADIIGYGGAAGGGKTDLLAGLVLTKHKRSLIVRREKAQTEGVVQRLTEIRGSTDGYSSQKGAWSLGAGQLVEFAGLDNPGDERRWQGRPHDLKAFDEVTEQRERQVRFVMGWNRTNDTSVRAKTVFTFNPPTTAEGRWVIDFFGPWLDKKHPLYPTAPGALRYCTTLPDETAPGGARDKWVDRPDPFVLVDGEPCYDFDPKAHKPEDIIKPKSRTFIPARLTDNPFYMATDYMQQLQSLPEPLRSQMLYGDFAAGVEDDAMQLVPTAWIEAAQARWKPQPKRGEMLTLGIDVARGGKDHTTLLPRHLVEGNPYWFGMPKRVPGKETPDGYSVAGLAIGMLRDSAPILVDAIGVGAAAVDALRATVTRLQVLGVNVSEAPTAADRTGLLRFRNKRDQYLWALRELLDPTYDTGAALPPDPQLLRELAAFKWKPVGRVIHVSSREEVVEVLGASPDLVTALMLALIDVPKIKVMAAANARAAVLAHDPYSALDFDARSVMDYEPDL